MYNTTTLRSILTAALITGIAGLSLFNGDSKAQTINIGPNQYAFRFTQNPNYGLFFNATNTAYDFRNGTGTAIWSINADNGQIRNDLQFAPNFTYRVAAGNWAVRSASAPASGIFFGTSDFEFRTLSGTAGLSMNATSGDVNLSGNLGINIASPEHKLHVGGTIFATTNNYAVRGVKTGTGTFPGVWGETESTSNDASGVRGYVLSTAPGTGSAGVWGRNFSTSNSGSGVRGDHDGGGSGVKGETVRGIGVHGVANPGDASGTAYGVFGQSVGTNATATRIGVYGTAAGGANNWAGYFAAGNTYVAGDLRIGTTTGAAGYKVSVNGGVMCTSVKVQSVSNWPDYVFDPAYKRMSIDALESFVTEHRHLPGIPSAAEVEAGEGFDLGEMQKKTLEKVEELTLYLIEQNETIKAQQELLDAYRQELDALKKAGR
jgi:hypothetical protein